MLPYGSTRNYNNYRWNGRMYAAKVNTSRARQEERQLIEQELSEIEENNDLDDLERLEEMYGHVEYEDWWYR